MKPAKTRLVSSKNLHVLCSSNIQRTSRAFCNKSIVHASTSAFVKPAVVQPQTWSPVRDRKDPITKAVNALEHAIESKDMVMALRVVTSLKRTGLKPPPVVYRLLMQLLSENSMHREVIALFDDALEIGVDPDKEMWNCLLQAHSKNFHTLSQTKEDMLHAGFELNSGSYRNIMQHHADSGNLVMCLRTLQEMKEKEISPDIPTVEALILLACRDHLPRIAHGLAIDYEERSSRRLNLSTWTHILAASAHNYYTRGLVDGWDRLKDGKITPDEGLCTMVINAAGVSRRPQLIWDAVNTLSVLNVPLQEHHIAPLMGSFHSKEQIPEALDLFEFMEEHHIQPTKFTLRGLRKLLATHDDVEAAIAHLRGRVEQGKRNFVGAYNSVLIATMKNHSNYTISLGKEMDDLKVTPTVDTFNILIHSAALRRNAPAAHAYYEEILQRGLEPNKETYERIIFLLTSEPVYDDAFLYLHKMMYARLVPSAEVLTALAKKCALRYDSRWKTLVKQMEKYAYLVSDELMTFLVTNGHKPMRSDSPALAIDVDPQPTDIPSLDTEETVGPGKAS
ncbi:hypothetical protein M408DRAFT_284973 [Serendipita vermifera MAFF 305830]|uniref:Pentatricopeptide repeat-containing protein-mitochondrial domain-containing protein n=1 Tax=Serendipita vermifera MAFF 305830 TaxID=933852 RepID=A0A0C3BFY1_SERVB|nr:hypothetical protein M408DRAFT_284973 [Serendipita vermifera MAFF 305830]